MATTQSPLSTSSADIPPVLLPVVGLLSSILTLLTTILHRIPGSPILVRYIKSSYQDDPWRSFLEVLLVAFAFRTLFSRRTRGEGEGKGLILSEKVSRGPGETMQKKSWVNGDELDSESVSESESEVACSWKTPRRGPGALFADRGAASGRRVPVACLLYGHRETRRSQKGPASNNSPAETKLPP